MVECEDKVVGRMYAKVAYHYLTAILEVSRIHIFILKMTFWWLSNGGDHCRYQAVIEDETFSGDKASSFKHYPIYPKMWELWRKLDQKRYTVLTCQYRCFCSYLTYLRFRSKNFEEWLQMQKDLFSLLTLYLFLSILVMKLAKLSLVGAWEIFVYNPAPH